MYETCNVCGNEIERDIFVAASTSRPTAVWLGVCGCRVRKWRWRSTSGDGPWELMNAESFTEPPPDPDSNGA